MIEAEKIDQDDVRTYKSSSYKEYYSFKTHLIDRFPKCRMFVAATPVKGIGKSYSA
jgi:hypothetical protein